MPPPRNPLSILQYSILFAAAALLLFAAFGWLTAAELRTLRANVEQSNLSQAHRELERAVERVRDEAGKMAAGFAVWQEVRQQLRAPRYYAYWRNHRMMSAGVLPDFVTSAAVYGPEGEALDSPGDGLLPASLDPAALGDQLVLGSEAQLLFFRPVAEPATDRVLGFVGLRAPFMPLLYRLNRFRIIDTDTLSIRSGSAERMAGSEMVPAFEYQLLANPETAAMEQLMTAALLKVGLVLGLVTLLVYPAMVYLVARPMHIISQHLDRLKHSADGVLLRPLKHELPVAELEKIRRSLNEYQSQLYEVHINLDEKNRELWALAHRDPLTGVANRRALEDYWESIRDLSTTLHFPLCFALFDINHFKAINDSYGHQVGDQVLLAVAETIVRVIGSHHHVYRLGGDEFATLLADFGPEQALRLAEACQTAVAAHPFEPLGVKEPIRISIGLACQEAGQAPDLLLLQRQADISMYSAKRPSGRQVVLFTPELDADARGLFSAWASSAVYEAIASGEGLTMFYQPVRDLGAERVRYYESLVRIVSDNELLPPSEIFPLVEARRLESELDRAILRRILTDLGNGKPPLKTGISINISGPTIVLPEICEWLRPFRDYMQDYYFVVEITETALITQLGAAQDNLSTLQHMGFSIALDDFGSGYSSLRYLASMPVDIVKFDISLVHSLRELPQRHIVLSLAKMIEKVGYALVAEGIEDREMLELVRKSGFQYAQGYYLGRPSETPESPSSATD